MKTKALTVSNKDIAISGDLAIDSGDYDWTLAPAAGGADQRIQGRYVTIWHRQTDGPLTPVLSLALFSNIAGAQSPVDIFDAQTDVGRARRPG